MSSPNDYAISVQQLPVSLGGGYYAIVPDLPGCMSDGETPAEAFANAQDAILSWIEAAVELGQPVPPASALDEPLIARRAG